MTEVMDTVIVAYGSEAVIEGSVRAAQRLGGAVVVVDHGDGASAARAASLGATTAHGPGNPGFGAGQNRGVALATSRYVLLCNPDAEVDPGAVRQGAAFLDGAPKVAAVQGVVLNRVTGTAERSHGDALGPVHLLGRALGARRLLAVRAIRRLARRSPVVRDHVEREPADPVEVDSLAATAILVRRAAFDAVGGFDPSYFLYGEDLDLCRRLRRAGWALVALPGVWATHQSGGSSESTVVRELHWWRGTMQYAARWWTTPQWVAAVAAAGVRAATMSVRSPAQAVRAWSSLVVTPLRYRISRPAVS